jgi:hypothetical protein
MLAGMLINELFSPSLLPEKGGWGWKLQTSKQGLVFLVSNSIKVPNKTCLEQNMLLAPLPIRKLQRL